MQGRFTSIDPGNYQAMLNPGDPQSWNAYSYVNNNPLVRVDRDGRGIWEKLKNGFFYGYFVSNAEIAKLEQERRDWLSQHYYEMDAEGKWKPFDASKLTTQDVFDKYREVKALYENNELHPLSDEEVLQAWAVVTTSTAPRPKPVNLPSSKKIVVDIEHIESGHMVGGSRVSPVKDLFPANMTRNQVEAAIKAAYENCSKLQTQGERVLVQGSSGKLTIQMWVNTTTNIIETAYPVW